MADELVVECITEVCKFFSIQRLCNIKVYRHITSLKTIFSELMFFYLFEPYLVFHEGTRGYEVYNQTMSRVIFDVSDFQWTLRLF